MVKQIGGSCAILVNALALNETLLSIRGVRVEARAGSPSPHPAAEPGQPVTPPSVEGNPDPYKRLLLRDVRPWDRPHRGQTCLTARELLGGRPSPALLIPLVISSASRLVLHRTAWRSPDKD